MSEKDLSHILERAVAEVIIREELEALLNEEKPLRLKMGFDPSRSDIHLGHAVGLRKLRQFQDMGHQVVLIVGDWTAQIGDPSGQSATRPMLTAQEVKDNARTYMEQFFKIVDEKRTEVRWQSEWFGDFRLADVIKLTSKFTVAQLLARDDFSKRYSDRKPIAITEFLYPLLQAYDSIMVEADVEFGGTDQKFNLLLGRELQSIEGQRPQQCLLVPILVGTDGVQRMSKSLGNYIGISESPKDTYFKVMRLKDDLMMPYFQMVTDVPAEELKEMEQSLDDHSVNPMDIKKRLAREIVTQFHGSTAAQQSESDFERVVQRKEAPDRVIEFQFSFRDPASGPNSEVVHTQSQETHYVISMKSLLVKSGVVSSGTAAKNLIEGGGVELDGVKLPERTYTLPLASIDYLQMNTPKADGLPTVRPSSLIKAGKRHVIKIVDAAEQEDGEDH